LTVLSSKLLLNYQWAYSFICDTFIHLFVHMNCAYSCEYVLHICLSCCCCSWDHVFLCSLQRRLYQICSELCANKTFCMLNSDSFLKSYFILEPTLRL